MPNISKGTPFSELSFMKKPTIMSIFAMLAKIDPKQNAFLLPTKR
jgi:hypothetical protein